MQAPPEQPIGPGGYPREPGYGVPEKFTMDMVMGIILIILSAFGACGSLALVGIGGAAGALGASAVKEKGGAELAAGGGLIMVLGIVYLIGCVAYIVGGSWMITSKKKGLSLVVMVGAGLLVLSIIMSVVSGSFSPVGIIIGLVFPGYAAARLYGNFGPRPV
jgi:hypothetical protein